MWRIRSAQDPPEYHPRLPDQPDISIVSARTPSCSNFQMSPAARVDDRGQMRKFPEVERTSGRHRSRSTSERFGLHPPLVGPHAPCPTGGGAQEVHVGAVRSHCGVATELPAPFEEA